MRVSFFKNYLAESIAQSKFIFNILFLLNYEMGAGFLPLNPSSRAVRIPYSAPPHCPNTWRAEPRKKNTLSFFKRNFTPAKSEMQGVFFFRGFRRVREAVAGRLSERTI